MKKKTNELDRAADLAYYKYFDGVQVNIMDLSKISADLKKLILAGADLNVEAPKLIEIYRHK